MLGLLMTAALAASPAGSGLIADGTEVVAARQTLDLGKGHHLEAIALSRKGDGPSGFVSSRAVVYSANCHVAFAQEFEGSPSTRFSTTVLGKERLLVLTTFYPEGSVC